MIGVSVPTLHMRKQVSETGEAVQASARDNKSAGVTERPGFKFQLHLLLAMCPWACSFKLLGLFPPFHMYNSHFRVSLKA